MFLKKNPSANKPETPVHETCGNPWRKCEGTDIAVLIVVNGETLPVCSSCWNEIADSNREW